MTEAIIPAEHLEATQVLWDYHNMHHELRPADVGIGLGSHDLGVATCAAQLYHQAMFGFIVFTGANAPTTIDRFPRGEAIHYAEHAEQLGVPGSSILIEPLATNTAENLLLTRALLAERKIFPKSAILISRPYQQRRALPPARRSGPRSLRSVHRYRCLLLNMSRPSATQIAYSTCWSATRSGSRSFPEGDSRYPSPSQ